MGPIARTPSRVEGSRAATREFQCPHACGPDSPGCRSAEAAALNSGLKLGLVLPVPLFESRLNHQVQNVVGCVEAECRAPEWRVQVYVPVVQAASLA